MEEEEGEPVAGPAFARKSLGSYPDVLIYGLNAHAEVAGDLFIREASGYTFRYFGLPFGQSFALHEAARLANHINKGVLNFALLH